MLVGNKKDLEKDRAVTAEEAAAQARTFGGIPTMEVSARSGDGVQEMFLSMVRQILRENPSAGGSGGSGVLGAGSEAKTSQATGKKRGPCSIL